MSGRSEKSCVGFLETHPRTGTGLTLVVLVLSGAALGGAVGFVITQVVGMAVGMVASG